MKWGKQINDKSFIGPKQGIFGDNGYTLWGYLCISFIICLIITISLLIVTFQ